MSNTKTLHMPAKASEKSGVMSVASTSKTWDIKNNTDTALVVIDAYLSDPASTAELYQRSLQLLSATDSQQCVKPGENKTITFGEAHKDSDGKPVEYTIILARADNLFPVKVIELPVTNDQDSFPATTVTADDARLMKQAGLFEQTIMAFPSSEMTKAYSAALVKPDAEKIAGFFSRYPQYGAINLDMVTAVQTYYGRYGFVWAGHTGDQFYNLYTSDGTTRKNLGTLSINYKAVGAVTNLDAPEGLTATYTDVNHRNTALHYSDGQFSDDITGSSPKICLQGLFILKGQLTGEGTDNQLIPVLYGVVNGNKVFGYNSTSQLLSATSVPPEVSALLDPQGVWGWLKLAGLIAGAIAAVAVLAVTFRYIIRAIKKGQTPALTPEQVERLNQQKVSKVLERMTDAGVKLPSDLTDALDNIKAEANNNLLTDTRTKLERILNKQRGALDRLMDYGRTDSLQKAWADTNKVIEHDLPFIDAEHIPEHINPLQQQISKNTKLISSRCEDLGAKITGNAESVISDARATATRLVENVKTNEDIREDLNDDRFPEIEE